IAVFGIDPNNLIIFRYPVRYLPQNRQNILQNLIDVRESINPDIVFLPTVSDIHQDHHTIYQEGLRAFRYTNMLGYELPWNNLSFNTMSFVHLEERHILKKVEALKKYISQSNRAYMNEEFVRSLARARGVQIGAHYAEAFEVIRLIIK
ncbi:MAG: PIG-L deacetylase family protein, partial [Candidatus Poribacteria bacterium]